jgi:murein DD-endopeptidase MepM/ murein hydrolase activator NlpD
LEPEGEAPQAARVLPIVGDSCAPGGNPVEGVLTQRYHRYHNGIDIGVPLGTPVLATHSGEVIYADWSTIGYGYLVIVQSDRYITYYAHNTSFNVEEGMLVGKGSILAWSGSTGNSSGPHVHYETRIDDVPVDPLTFSARGLPTC